MRRTLLLISPQSEFGTSLEDLARKEGWEFQRRNGQEPEWMAAIRDTGPNIVAIDSDIGDVKSLEVCKTVRSLTTDIGLILLTERRDEINLIVALEVGADNYIRKPVSPRVLLAYASSLLRRLSASKKVDSPYVHSQLTYGTLNVDPETREVTLDKRKIDLSSSEFDLLYLLATHAGQVLSRQRIMEELRGTDYNGIDRSIDLKISRLRKYLGDDSVSPKRIKTVRGKGYLLNKYAWN